MHKFSIYTTFPLSESKQDSIVYNKKLATYVQVKIIKH